MSEIIIRKANRNDMNDVLRLLFDDERARQRDQYRKPEDKCYSDAYQEILLNPLDFFLVACEDEHIVGITLLRLSRHIACKGKLRATIECVRVDKEKRSQGIGTQLIEYAIGLAKSKDCFSIELLSHVSRVRAHEFYERLGFSRSHVGMKMEL